MKTKHILKKDIAVEFSKKQNISIRKSQILVEDFLIVKDMLIEDNPYTRIEIEIFGVFESKPTKAKPKARNPRTNEEGFMFPYKKLQTRKLLKISKKAYLN